MRPPEYDRHPGFDRAPQTVKHELTYEEALNTLQKGGSVLMFGYATTGERQDTTLVINVLRLTKDLKYEGWSFQNRSKDPKEYEYQGFRRIKEGTVWVQLPQRTFSLSAKIDSALTQVQGKKQAVKIMRWISSIEGVPSHLLIDLEEVDKSLSATPVTIETSASDPRG